MDFIKGDLDDNPFHVCDMKEKDYVMQLMTNYSINESIEDDKIRIVNGHKINLKHPESVYNYYGYIQTM